MFLGELAKVDREKSRARTAQNMNASIIQAQKVEIRLGEGCHFPVVLISKGQELRADREACRTCIVVHQTCAAALSGRGQRCGCADAVQITTAYPTDCPARNGGECFDNAVQLSPTAGNQTSRLPKMRCPSRIYFH